MTVSRPVSWARYGYLLSAGVFAVSVLVQVYIAGMAVFVDPTNWGLHTSFVHLFEPILVVLLLFAFLGRLPRTLKLAPVGLFLLVSVQYATASVFGSLVAAFHPVNALVLFVATMLTMRHARTWTTGAKADQ